MASQNPGTKMPSRPAPRVPPNQNISQSYESPPDPFSPPKMKLDISKDKKRAPPRPPPPRLNTNQGSNHFRSIFGSSKRNPKKGAATAIVKPLPPSTTNIIPTGTLIDLQTPPSSPKSQKYYSESIWSSGNVSKNSSPFESGFEDDFSSIISSATTTPTADIWSDISPDKSEPFEVNPIKLIPPPSTVATSRPTIICVPKAKPSRPPPPRLDGSPPMPSMPPPPPPPNLLEVLTKGPEIPPRPLTPYEPKNDAGLPTCKAQYDYDSNHPDDLQFKTGDVITILNKEGDEWFKGRLKGNEGIFPASYVTLLPNSVKKPLMTVIALFSFAPCSWDDLELQEGDQIEVLDRVNDDWLYGECMGKRGQFPECYVQDISALADDD